MKTLRALIRGIRRDKARAQILAIDDDGLEHRIEVPLAAVEGLHAGTLVLTYQLEPAAPSPVDQQFAAMMAQPRAAARPPTTEALAQLLGLAVNK